MNLVNVLALLHIFCFVFFFCLKNNFVLFFVVLFLVQAVIVTSPVLLMIAFVGRGKKKSVDWI